MKSMRLIFPAISYYYKSCNAASGVQRSGDARGDCFIVCPLSNSNNEQWRMVVMHRCWLYTVCDVTI